MPSQDDVRDYNRYKNLTPNRDLFAKYFADLKRVCEVEDTVLEWYDEAYVKVKSLRQHIVRHPDIEVFKRQFDIVKAEVGGLDFSVWKILLKARKNPSVKEQYYPEMNIGVKIVTESNECLCNEVKRVGSLIDSGRDIELRPGDQMIAYISMGGFEK